MSAATEKIDRVNAAINKARDEYAGDTEDYVAFLERRSMFMAYFLGVLINDVDEATMMSALAFTQRLLPVM